jgi:hypothetical protein
MAMRRIANMLMLRPSPPGWWRSVDPAAPGSGAGSLMAWTFAACSGLALFLWFGGLLRVQSTQGPASQYLSALPTARMATMEFGAGVGPGHQIASVPAGLIMIGPYRTAPLNIARCIAAAASVGVGILLMRFVSIPAAWSRSVKDDPDRCRRAASAATVACARIAAAHVTVWIAVSVGVFALAMLSPPGTLALVAWLGRGALAALACLWQGFLLWQVLGAHAADGAVRGRTLPVALHVALNGIGLLLLVWAGAALVA